MSIYQQWGKNKLFNKRTLDHVVSNYMRQYKGYHNITHLNECFDEFNEIRTFLERPDEVELAIWFHDAIYEPGAQNNEEKSAQLLQKMFEHNIQDTSYAQQLILATKDHKPFDHDSTYFLDIDMSILGKSRERFLEYNKGIREEFKEYSDEKFKLGRMQFFESISKPSLFLPNERIYDFFHTNHFKHKYKESAQENIDYLMRQLKKINLCM